MKSLVTGGAGFIGSNLVDKLVELNHEVTVIDNLSTGQMSNLQKSKNKINFIKKDISDQKDDIESYFKNVNWVFHLAGLADIVPSITNPSDYFNCNVNGTLKILEASRKANVKKFVYAASASCYGIPEKFPTKEDSNIDPKYPYALTKYLGEELVLHWGKVYKMPNISARLFNAYGPRSRTTGAYGAVFGVFLAQKIANAPLTIVGDGNQTRDFIHVSDLVNALIKIAEKGKNLESYNIASGKETSVNTVANLIGGKKIQIPERPGEPKRSLGDIDKIKSELNWKPKTTIEEGIKDLLNNIDDWKSAPVWTPEKIEKETEVWFKLLKK